MIEIPASSMFTVPISQDQFKQLDTLLETLPGIVVIALTIDHKRREFTFIIGKPAPVSTIPLYMLRNLTQALQASMDADKTCACAPGENCPDCIAANTFMVYAWAVQHLV